MQILNSWILKYYIWKLLWFLHSVIFSMWIHFLNDFLHCVWLRLWTFRIIVLKKQNFWSFLINNGAIWIWFFPLIFVCSQCNRREMHFLVNRCSCLFSIKYKLLSLKYRLERFIYFHVHQEKYIHTFYNNNNNNHNVFQQYVDFTYFWWTFCFHRMKGWH